ISKSNSLQANLSSPRLSAKKLGEECKCSVLIVAQSAAKMRFSVAIVGRVVHMEIGQGWGNGHSFAGRYFY
ncbi:MAG: hypothetical protein FWB97_09610, partial [Oscillospiraceae bacterium]|nr:hypothetical protein [Oscillospiraceae bacterium]